MKLGLVPLAALLLSACAEQAVFPVASGEIDTVFARVKSSPPRLRAFLADMPKGADLHIHLSGAVYAESNLSEAAGKNNCLDTLSQKILTCPGDATSPTIVPMATVLRDKALYNRAVDAQSLRNFVPAPGLTAHDQFFNTFDKFGTNRDIPAMMAEILNRAGRQQVNHVEVMLTFGADEMNALLAKVTLSGPFETQLATLEAAGLDDLIPVIGGQVKKLVADTRLAMECDGIRPQPGCAVSVRFLQQISRNSPPDKVALQTVFAFRLAAAEPLVAGVNIVSVEDGVVALRDYPLHMRMIGTMAARYPQVGVALHAGELTLGLVPPEQLRFHIRQAIEIGRAQRIGHGVDLMYEDDPYGLLELMRQRPVAVEINLSSNDAILGVAGADHPFPVYREEGVPTVLSTDDEAVSRSDLTHEYQRAVQEFGLTYRDLKALSRRGLEYAFLPGASLWADLPHETVVPACAAPTSESCASYLAVSEKARAQMRLETAFTHFEARQLQRR